MSHDANMWNDVCLVLDQSSGIGFGGADLSSTVQKGFEPRTLAYVVLCEAQVEGGLPQKVFSSLCFFGLLLSI